MVGKILKTVLEILLEGIKMWYYAGFNLIGSEQPVATIFGIVIIAALTWLIGSIVISIVRTFVR